MTDGNAQTNVTCSIINEFVGTLRLKGLGKGVIITIASFSRSTSAMSIVN